MNPQQQQGQPSHPSYGFVAPPPQQQPPMNLQQPYQQPGGGGGGGPYYPNPSPQPPQPRPPPQQPQYHQPYPHPPYPQPPPPQPQPQQQQRQQYHYSHPPPQANQPQNYPPPPPQQQQQQQQHAPPPLPTAPPAQQQAGASPHPSPAAPAPTVTPPPQASAPSTATTFKLENDVLVTRVADEETEDGRVRNAEAIGKIRDTWIYKQVRLRQAEFTQFRQATVFLGTWNVNAKGKPEDALDEWLFADCRGRDDPLPDLVAVAFQEIVDLNAVNVAVDNKTQQKSQFWTERILSTLNQRDSYVLLSQRSMVGLLICVYTRAAHQRRVNHVSSASVGVGVMGMMGNKGGVAVRIQFYDSTLVFVSSHLAAHRENVTGRNADFANVLSKTTFDVGEDAIREVIRSGSMSHWVIGSSSVGIPDHDVVFWLGDLNYRIDESMMTEKVLQLSEKGVLDELRTLDQLNVERAAGRVFEGFEEGVLNFRPTYKYQPGTHTYEQRPDKKLRAPAWCDRILWMAQEPQHVQQLSYNRSELPNCSDHKPVFSTMRLTVKDVVQAKREAIYDELMKLLDRFENQTLPMLGLDRVNLDYGEVRYDQSVTLPVRITNTGSVVAQFRLVPKLDEARVCKPWMKVSPAYGMLIPGDEPAVMNFTVAIDKSTAQMLNTGREVLDDIVILRLENGRDYYFTVKASYARSCFGMSAEELVMYSDPIRSVPLDAVKRAEMMDAKPVATALCVPKELWRLVDAIYEKGLGEPHLFVERGVREEVNHIRECLDTGTRFGPFRIHSYAEALVSFLESLASPIVPSHVFPAVEIDSVNIQSSARRLLEELPPIHYNVFVYVISFFREVLQHQSRNLLSAAKVARICCGCLAPGTGLDSSSSSLQKRTGMQLLMLHLLETSSI